MAHRPSAPITLHRSRLTHVHRKHPALAGFAGFRGVFRHCWPLNNSFFYGPGEAFNPAKPREPRNAVLGVRFELPVS